MTDLATRSGTFTTACTLDCPDTCSLAVTVENGVITDIDAAPGNPFTQDWICSKVKRQMNRVYAPERVRVPQIRTGAKGSGEFREATWEEAIELIAARMRTAIDEVGPDAIVPYTYNSSAGAHESNGFTEALFSALGATNVAHTICAYTTSAAWSSVYDGMTSTDPLDIVHAKLIVIWGANPTVSNTHLPPLVQQAAAAGARVVVVDPRRTPIAKRADLHLALRPGTDVVLALAVANAWNERGWIDRAFLDAHTTGADELLAAAAEWSIERAAEACGLTVTDIETFVEWYGTMRPATLRSGWGQERSTNGGAACRSILALPALVNHFGVLGGGTLGSTGGSSGLKATNRWPAFTPPASPRREVNMHQIGAWLAPDAGDPCRVLLVQGGNPAVMCPDSHAVARAFSRDDIFTVVHEQVFTDTTRYADVVLPATTAFEVNDVATSYGSFTVQPVNAVIDRVGESRSNDEVGLALANALGFDWRGEAGPSIEDPGPRITRTSTIQFVDVFPKGGRLRLVDERVGAPSYVPVDATFPLTLITPASPKLISSMFGEFQSPRPTVMLHPDDATARSLRAGQFVMMRNELGEVEAELVVSDDTRPGVAVAPKGVWLRNYAGGVGVNALMTPAADPFVNGACFNDTRIEVTAR